MICKTTRAALLVSALALLGGCDDSTSSTETTTTSTQSYSDAKARGTITIYLRNQVDGSVIANATATLLGSTPITATSDAAGIVQFTGVEPGSRLVKIEATGYAGKIITADLFDGSSDVPRVQDFSKEILLPLKGASVSGRVYLTDKLGNRTVLKGAKVDLAYASESSSSWIEGNLSTVTDSTGAYGFAKLPEDISLKITVRSIDTTSTTFIADGNATVGGLKAGEKRFLDPINLLVNAESFQLLTTGFDAIAATDSIRFLISTPVDTTALRNGDIVVTSGSDKLGAKAIWSNSAKSLTLVPFDSRWPTGTLAVALNLKSPIGQGINKSINVTVGSVSSLPDPIKALAYKGMVQGKLRADSIDGPTATVEFKWNKAARADGYYVYKKALGDKAYILYQTVSDAKDTVVSVNTADMFAEGDTVSFLVASYNAKGVSALDAAPKKTLTDMVAPKLSSDPGEFTVAAAPNNAAAAKDSLKIGSELSFNFTEPMDTALRPVISSENMTAAKINLDSIAITWNWVSKTQAKVALYVLPKYDASAMDIKISVDISTLRDENRLIATSPKGDWLSLLAKAPAAAPATP